MCEMRGADHISFSPESSPAGLADAGKEPFFGESMMQLPTITFLCSWELISVFVWIPCSKKLPPEPIFTVLIPMVL